jgi:anti-sigma regulatory factor (Ser/Thr protein kinase)
MSDADVFVLTLDPSAGSVAVARRTVMNWARRVNATCIMEVVTLLVSEVATNAVQHAGTPYTMKARWRPPLFRVDVIDFAPPFRRVARRPDQLGGWGFEFLDRLSHAWGIDDHGDSKAVWFDVEQPALT